MNIDFNGKVAIVTGAGGGIGRVVSLALVAAGAKVAVVDLAQRQGLETERQINAAGGQSLFVAADVSRADAVANYVAQTLRAWGRIDVFINNAAWEGAVKQVASEGLERRDRRKLGIHSARLLPKADILMKLISWIGFAAFAASTSAVAQVTLNANTWVPHTHPLTTAMMSWCADVEKATAARVKCNLLPKPVVGATQTFDAVRDGLADLSFTVHGFTPGRFLLAEITEFPFLGDTGEITAAAYQRIYDKYLAKADEHKGVITLAVLTHGPGQIFNTKRPILASKDLEGLRMRLPGGMVNETAKALGVTPILKPPAEIYEMLSSGVADGVFFPKEAVFTFKVIPVIKYATYVPGGLYNVSIMYMMNPATWAKISTADQGEIMKLSGESLARRGAKAYDEGDAKGEAAVREAKIQVVNASPELMAVIARKSGALERAWIERAKTRGVDGEAALKALRAEIAAMSKKK